MARLSSQQVIVAWTDVGGTLPRVRVAKVDIARSEAGS
jgi:hypothetical protein